MFDPVFNGFDALILAAVVALTIFARFCALRGARAHDVVVDEPRRGGADGPRGGHCQLVDSGVR